MKIIPENNLESFALPLPIYRSIRIADAIGNDGEKFSIFVGLDRNLVEQLKRYSADINDTELQKNTSDYKRFVVGAYDNWYKKNRTPFALVDRVTSTLAALIWFGPKPLGIKSPKHLTDKELKEEKSLPNKDNWYTISYRSYPHFRGRGLMKDFGSFVMNFYLKKFPNAKLWTSTNSENIAGTAYASNLGFKLNEGASDYNADWLVMTRE